MNLEDLKKTQLSWLHEFAVDPFTNVSQTLGCLSPRGLAAEFSYVTQCPTKCVHLAFTSCS